jgi:dCTP diphosphatase
MTNMEIDTNRLQTVINQILTFNHNRGWKPVPSDIAKSIIIEASELLEHFQWDESQQTLGKEAHQKDWTAIKAEIADVFWYLITFCNETDIDLVDALEQKISMNEKKYPAEAFGGEHNPTFYKEQKRKYRRGE